MRFQAAAALLVTAAALSAPALAQTPPGPQVLLGEVTAVSPTSVTLTVEGKPETVKLSPKLVVYVLTPTTPDQIKPGSFVGTTNIPSSTGGRSTEVHIFPPGVKLGEGDRPWPSQPGAKTASRMTNGAVTGVQRAETSRMTNGSVGAVKAAGGALSFDVAYAGGTKRVTVPKGTQITTMNPGAISDVKPGAGVTVIAITGADGVRQASLINIEPPGK